MLKKILAIGIAALLMLQSGCSFLGETEGSEYVDIGSGITGSATDSVPPQTKPDGSRFTLAYADIDPYPITGLILYYIIMGLREEGWISFDYLPFDPNDTDAGALIDWLAARDIGPYIRFDSSANYYLAFQEEEEIRASLTQHVNNGTIDVILTMGTWPASMIKSFELDIPVMMFASVDPVGSGLVDSIEDSGHPNLWATFDPTANERQLVYYYNCIPFTNLGIIYYDEVIAAVGAYERAAQSLGVRMTHGQINRIDASSESSIEMYYADLVDAFREIADTGIDAFMLTTDIIIDVDRTEELLEPFTSQGIPVFVQVDSGHVEHGALLNVSAYEVEGLGVFSARSIAGLLTGTPLSQLPQEFRNSPFLVLNLDVAEKIGYRPTFETLLAAEQIYTSADS